MKNLPTLEKQLQLVKPELMDDFPSGLCLSFYKECATTAPGDCLICLLLSSGLQPGKTIRLQTTNGK